jgi:Lrp/AsnC family leucine-responsive transcriptional regulator
VALDRGVLAYVTVDSTAWMGDSAEAFAAPPEIQEAHVIAGSASMLVKVRTATTERLQDVLRRPYAIDGVSGTHATVVLETLFGRPVHAG